MNGRKVEDFDIITKINCRNQMKSQLKSDISIGLEKGKENWKEENGNNGAYKSLYTKRQ